MDRLRRLGRARLVAAAGVAVVVVALVGWLLLRPGGPQASAEPSPSATESPTPSPSPSPSASPTSVPGIACPLSGLPIDDVSVLDRTALAVQIENHPLARPARNLSNADFVIEAPVEGDTTRFTAVFLCNPTVGLTGPIRSARYYNVDVWQDLHVLPVGFGASNGALQRFAVAGMPYVNGITGSWPWFRRAGSHVSPHNLYGDVEAIRAALGSGGAIDGLAAKVGPLRPLFVFDPEVVLPSGHAVAKIEIRTSSAWRFGWTWDATSMVWVRSDTGRQVVDEVTGDALTADHVLVQRVTQETVLGDPDPGGNSRRLQHLVGEGDGVLYSDGRAIALRWSRPTAEDGTRWTYADSGEGVVLPPGVVWWEIVPVTAGVTES